METISFMAENGDFLVIPSDWITAVFEMDLKEEGYQTKIYLSCGKVFYILSSMEDLGCEIRNILEGAKSYEAFDIKSISDYSI